MKAVVISEWSDPQKFPVKDVEDPTPAPGEVLVEVHYSAVNFGDTLIATGRYQVKPNLPFVPGAECSGIVQAVGEGVSDYAVGDHVAACGFVGDARKEKRILGALAQLVSVPTVNLAKVPDTVSLEEAAAFRSPNETSYYGLKRGQLQPGETLLVLGAGGATGFAAVELGKMMGAHVIASASSEEKRNIALAGGADVAIDSRDPDWRGLIKEVTQGRGVDVVYDPVGGDATEPAFRSIARGGRLLVIGFAAGRIPSLPTNLALIKDISLVGANLLQAMQAEPETTVADSKMLMEAFGRGDLSVPPITRTYPLEEAGQAYADVAGGKISGRIVVDVKG